MKNLVTFSISYIFILLVSSCYQTTHSNNKIIPVPCVNKLDTTFHLQFTKDTSTTDFYQLIAFIESKGLFSGFERKKSLFGDSMLLQRLICKVEDYTSPNDIFNVPKEYWLLHNIFSISYNLVSTKPMKKNRQKYFPAIYNTIQFCHQR